MAYNGNAMPSAITNGLRRQQMADAGGYGSIAARFAPNQYGSIASRQFPGAFGGMPDGQIENPDQVNRDNQIIQQNQRTLSLRNQGFELANPSIAEQIYTNNRALSLRRQNLVLNPPNLGLDDQDENQY